MRRTLRLPFALCLALLPVETSAAIIGSCTIMVQGQGTLKNNPAINVLGSKQAGGAPATATVKPSSLLCSILNLLDCYSISSPAPAGFLTAPGSGGTGVGFATSFKLNGVEHPGNTPFRVANGTYNMQVDLTATKSAGIFTAGLYRAEVLVRCE